MALHRVQALSKDVSTKRTYSSPSSAAEKSSLVQGYRKKFLNPNQTEKGVFRNAHFSQQEARYIQ